MSPYFKTYLSRGLNKVKLQMSHAAAAAAAVQEQQPAAFAAVPAPAGRQESSDGGMAPSGTARTASSTWSTPDGDASAHPTVITSEHPGARLPVRALITLSTGHVEIESPCKCTLSRLWMMLTRSPVCSPSCDTT